MSAIPMHSTRVSREDAQRHYEQAVAARATRTVPADLIAAPAPEYHRPEPVVVHVYAPALPQVARRVPLAGTNGCGFLISFHRPE